MNSSEILKLSNIRKSYQGKSVLNLDEISIKRGEVYGLIGPNGAGKSTLMKIISSLIQADSGDIEIFGQILHQKNRLSLLKKIGVFIEGPAYYEHLTAAENMKIIKNLKGLSDSDIYAAVEYVGLTNQMSKKVGKYSLGMKQRLGLAMSLSGLPPFMILDEPTNGLDPQGIKEIRNLILYLSETRGITIMISSHILDEMEKMASHIGIINRGNLLYQGDVKSFKNKFGSEIALKTSDNVKTLAVLDKYSPKLMEDYVLIKSLSDNKIADIVRGLNALAIDIYRVYDVSKSLEDLFIELTGEGSL